MIVELPDRTVIHYPWVFGAIVSALGAVAIALLVNHISRNYGESESWCESALWGLPFFVYGLAGKRRRTIILDDGVAYRGPLGTFHKTRFADVKSIQETRAIIAVGQRTPMTCAEFVLRVPDGT